MAHTAHKTKREMRERVDPPDVLSHQLDTLAAMVRSAKHFVVSTGAGISTSSGIPDFRGPQGVWTLEKQGKERTLPSVDPEEAYPTVAHMSLVALLRAGILKHLISTNCDGLHRKSGVDPKNLSELHGCGNIEECEKCEVRYYRDFCVVTDRDDHFTGRRCAICNGRLLEWTVDFGKLLPEEQLARAEEESTKADLHVVLGSSCRVTPACDLPGLSSKMVVVNLQVTPLDSKCALRIFGRTDDVMRGLMQRFGLEIPAWTLTRKLLLIRNLNTAMLTSVVPFEEAVPASVVKSVTWTSREKSRIVRKLEKEPFTFDGQTPAVLRVRFYGHYHEPDFEVEFKGPEEPRAQYIILNYDAFARSWTSTDRILDVVPRLPGKLMLPVSMPTRRPPPKKRPAVESSSDSDSSDDESTSSSDSTSSTDSTSDDSTTESSSSASDAKAPPRKPSKPKGKGSSAGPAAKCPKKK